MKTIATIFGVVCGAIGGIALGVLAALCVLAWVKSLNLNHPGEDVARMLIVVTAPVGVMTGAVLGGLTIASRPRLFLTTFLPLTILILVIVYFVGSLKGMDRL